MATPLIGETMERADIIETNLIFVKSLTRRSVTDMIVIHHTGENDIDASAAQIHQWHLNNPGWAGIGYHFVIRKNGDIERGRPEWAVGSHAYGENSHTIGIHLSGDFMTAYPTAIQIEKAALLIANICEDYGIPTDRAHIVGHGELMPTDCPGVHLQALLNDGTLTGKANYYRYGEPKSDSNALREAAWQEDLQRIQEELAREGEAVLRYNTVVDLPEWAKPTISKMIAKGLLGGNGAKDAEGNPTDLDLSLDMVRIFVVSDRAGNYDN